jgi:hypothetical protein
MLTELTAAYSLHAAGENALMFEPLIELKLVISCISAVVVLIVLIAWIVESAIISFAVIVDA